MSKNINDLKRLSTVSQVVAELRDHFSEYDFSSTPSDDISVDAQNPLVKRLVGVLLPYLKKENPTVEPRFATLKYIKVSDFWPGRTDDSSEFSAFYTQLRYYINKKNVPIFNLTQKLLGHFEIIDILIEFLILETFEKMTMAQLCEVIEQLQMISKVEDPLDGTMISNKKLFYYGLHNYGDSTVLNGLTEEVDKFSKNVTTNFSIQKQKMQDDFFQNQLSILLFGFKLKLETMLEKCELSSFVYLLNIMRPASVSQYVLSNTPGIRRTVLRIFYQSAESLIKNVDDYLQISECLAVYQEMFYLNKITNEALIAMVIKAENPIEKLALVLSFKNTVDQAQFLNSIAKENYMLLFKSVNDVERIKLAAEGVRNVLLIKIQENIGFKSITTSIKDYNKYVSLFGENSVYVDDMLTLKTRYDTFKGVIEHKNIQNKNPDDILWKLACSVEETDAIVAKLKDVVSSTVFFNGAFNLWNAPVNQEMADSISCIIAQLNSTPSPKG